MSDREVLVGLLLKQTEDLLSRTRRQIEAISATDEFRSGAGEAESGADADGGVDGAAPRF
jgi:hypothetical protein